MNQEVVYVLSCGKLSTDSFKGPKYRVMIIPASIKFVFSKNEVYSSLRELKSKNKVLKLMKISNIKQYNWITNVKNIIKVKDFAFSELGNLNMEYQTLLHSLYGAIKKGRVIGGHCVSPNLHDSIRVKNMICPIDKNGVVTAIIEKFDRNRDRWIEKETPSTLFPFYWSPTQLLFECKHALKGKSKLLNTEKCWESITMTGIPVKVVLKSNGELESIYPISLTFGN